MRKGFLSIEWQDIEKHGLLIASVLAFTRYRHRFDPEWAPSRRVIAKEFKLGRVVAQDTVDKVCDILGIAHKRTTKKARTSTKPNHIVNTEPNHIDERNRTTSGTKPNHISNENEPPNIYNYNRASIEQLPYPHWQDHSWTLIKFRKVHQEGTEWFWLATRQGEQVYLWDSYNMPPTDTEHDFAYFGMNYCGLIDATNMVQIFGSKTPDHFKEHIDQLNGVQPAAL